MRRGSLAIGGLAIGGWLVIIIASGAGWNPFRVPWNFTNTGGFGDSFGPLGALMAGMALALGGALIMGRVLSRRVEAIATTGKAVGVGMVTGPVNIPLTGFPVWLCAYRIQSSVMGSGR